MALTYSCKLQVATTVVICKKKQQNNYLLTGHLLQSGGVTI